MARWKPGWRARAVHLCPSCGRALDDLEICECSSPLPRDGLRAKCRHFETRVNYLGRHYINCGGKKYVFPDREARDRYYEECCCGACDTCTIAAKTGSC